MAVTETLSETSDLHALVGTWRRFGAVGPVYEIIGVDHRMADGDRMMRIRVLESGEEVGYKLTDLMEDPVEA